jgi:hypothetical protein
MAVTARIVPEPVVQKVFSANSSNLAATSEILELASSLDAEKREKLFSAVRTMLNNSDVITTAMSEARAAS